MKYTRAIDIRYTNFDATSGLDRIHGENAEHVIEKLINWIAKNRAEHTPVMIVEIIKVG